MNTLIALMFTTLLNAGTEKAKAVADTSVAQEYKVTQVIEHRQMFLVQKSTSKYLCRSLTPCFGLYTGEIVLFTKNPVSYNGQKIYYMDNAECRIDNCEPIF